MADITFKDSGLLNLTPEWGAPEIFDTFDDTYPYMIPTGAATLPESYVLMNQAFLNVEAPDAPTGGTMTIPSAFQWELTNQMLQDGNADTGDYLQFMAIEGVYNNAGTVEPCFLVGGAKVTDHITVGLNSYSLDCYFYLSTVMSFEENYLDNTKIIETLGQGSFSLTDMTTFNSVNKVKFGLTLLRLKYDAEREPLEYSTPWFNYALMICFFDPQRDNAYDVINDVTLTVTHLGWCQRQEVRMGIITLNNVLMFEEWNDTLFSFEEMSEEVGPPSEPGGYDGGPHAFDDSSDSIAVPSVPQIGALATGFIHAYNPEVSDLANLGSELLPQLTFPAPAPITAGSSVMETLADMFDSAATWMANIPSIIENGQKAKMIDYVVDCHLIPVKPSTGSSQAIRVGWQTLQSTAKICTNDYVYKSLGEINLYEFYQNFADYLGHGRLFIPFVGFVGVQPEWFNNTALSIEYLFNIIDGSFTAYLSGRPISSKHTHLKSKVILGQWGGSCCVHIPITGTNYANMMSGAIGGAAGAIQSAGTGNLAGAATGAISAMSARAGVEQSNSYSASAAFMGGREAYIMMERPVSSWSKTYQHEIGIPSNISATLGDLSGFAKVENIHLDGVSATEAEKAEIEALLRQGVIF